MPRLRSDLLECAQAPCSNPSPFHFTEQICSEASVLLGAAAVVASSRSAICGCSFSLGRHTITCFVIDLLQLHDVCAKCIHTANDVPILGVVGRGGPPPVPACLPAAAAASTPLHTPPPLPIAAAVSSSAIILVARACMCVIGSAVSVFV